MVLTFINPALKYTMFRGLMKRSFANIVGAGLAREGVVEVQSRARRRSYAGIFGGYQ